MMYTYYGVFHKHSDSINIVNEKDPDCDFWGGISDQYDTAILRGKQVGDMYILGQHIFYKNKAFNVAIFTSEFANKLQELLTEETL